jgi:hypothetical protein
MFRRFASSLSILRPRALAQTRKSLDDLLRESRETRRATKALIEEQRAARAEVLRLSEENRARHEATSLELAKIREDLAALALRESQVRAILRADAAGEMSAASAAAAFDEQRIAGHVRAALDRAEMSLEPFPHVIVENLLPPDLYDELIAGIPPSELFADNPLNKRQLRVPFALAPSRSRRVWRFMAEVVADRILTDVVVDKFREPLARWITETRPSLDGDPIGPMRMHSSDGRILLRHRGYLIPPHRDPKWGFLTCLIYLVRPGDSQQWGTQLFSVDEDPEATGAAPHWIDPEKCRLVTDVPFRPNTALMFLNSKGAHGAAIPLDAQPADLERYAYQFRIGPSRRAIRELTDLLPDERRPLWAGKLSM